MTNHDGITELDAIIDRVKDLCGGRVYEDLPDSASLPRDGNGGIKPFIHIATSDPIPTGRGRGLGRDTVQPHILVIQVTIGAAASTDVKTVAAAVRNRYLGWAPAGNNASPLTASGTRSLTRVDEQGVPTRRERISSYETIINLSPAAA